MEGSPRRVDAAAPRASGPGVRLLGYYHTLVTSTNTISVRRLNCSQRRWGVGGGAVRSSSLDIAIRQCLLEFGYGSVGDLGIAEVHALELRQSPDVHQPRVGDV